MSRKREESAKRELKLIFAKKVLYHQEEEMYRFLEETILLRKREVMTDLQRVIPGQVGWQLKNLVNALWEDPNGVILTLKKRPQNTLVSAPALLKNVRWKPLALQTVIPTSPTSSSTTPTSTMGMSSEMDNSALQDVFILSPMSGLYGPRDEIGIMSCDDISKFGKSGMKGSESPNYFLEHKSGKYYTLIEGEGHPGGSEYDRSRATGLVVLEVQGQADEGGKTPTETTEIGALRQSRITKKPGDLRPVLMPTEYSWIGESKEQNMYKRGSREAIKEPV
ncbi:hypothetical protein DUI87_01986 [Hirundo rustica rustica]|uniref:DUF1170 domain-containing protein n=1 Tax=Hirundo rustica rustica TaxID=333673 RepID=A0A3M0L6Y5_HIRRU|nr:hypothetical protein DUI87_01986 [Hirundo rustica rustica]